MMIPIQPAEARISRSSYPAERERVGVHVSRGCRRKFDTDRGGQSSAPKYSTTTRSMAGWCNLGGLTLPLSRCWKPERRRSGGC